MASEINAPLKFRTVGFIFLSILSVFLLFKQGEFMANILVAQTMDDEMATASIGATEAVGIAATAPGKMAEAAVTNGAEEVEPTLNKMATGEEVDAFLHEEHPIFDSKKEEDVMTGKQYTSSELPLKPPFYIIQQGTPRSGSTFQVTLLNTIVNLKTQQWYDALGESPPKISLTFKTPPPSKGTQGPFVVKTHAKRNTWMNDLKERFGITTRVFTSSNLNHTHVNTSLHHQALPNMYNCSLCEVDSYVPIFGLSQEDVKLLKDFMSSYEILRQCCGLQQSKYNRYRLHGCNVTQLLIDQPDIHYPHCEQHDLPKLEKEFDALPLNPSQFKNNYSWKKPGDCAHYDKKIIAGRDFNNRKFVSCAVTHPWATHH